MNQNLLIILSVTVGLFLILFLVGRKLMLWYWKTETTLDLLTKSHNSQKQMIDLLNIQIAQNDLLIQATFGESRKFVLTNNTTGEVKTVTAMEYVTSYRLQPSFKLNIVEHKV